MKKAFKTYFNWSSGKDSAIALYYLLQDQNFKIDRLLTTVNSHYDRVSMHGLSRKVLEAQAAATAISLDVLEVPENPTMEEYNSLMTAKIKTLKESGYTHTAFGDIFLEDLKEYRENMLSALHVKAVFPIWKRDTRQLIGEFLKLGFKAVIVCIDNTKINASFLGKTITQELIDALPDTVDPCGENGEFHTFCFDGPIFKAPIAYEIGEHVFRTYDNPSDKSKSIRFGFCDVLLKE
ncbi:diphthine--ammonia ligase [Maribacter sp. 2210JD10-5]|uniref:Dph6-related ATP pyrophosphatase n=1 Tax=Maribacter sp. 2210JD10-5 TaxID=3386272 RepID=UPI0039BD8DC3